MSNLVLEFVFFLYIYFVRKWFNEKMIDLKCIYIFLKHIDLAEMTNAAGLT